MAKIAGGKRKRDVHSDEEKLNYQANQQLQREIKKVKTFEIQKQLKVISKDPKNPTLQSQLEFYKV